MKHAGCVFCKVVAGEVDAHRVFEDEFVVVFLDSRPLFDGHCLICPKEHFDTLPDVPAPLLEPMFSVAQLVSRAVEHGLGAEGSLLAVNNKVSQSVPHLHLHIIPRRKGDGMRGFFWPRHPYRDHEHIVETQTKLRSAISYLRSTSA